MRSTRRLERYLVLFLLSCFPAFGQHHHDPLNQLEIDQLREATLEPDKRLKLFIEFARGRLASLEKDRSDPKVTNRAEMTHQWLDDFLQLYDELNDNIDMYIDRKEDLRKILPVVIEADTEFQSKLRALKDAAGVSSKEASTYEFVLSTAMETIDSSVESHRQLLKQQEEDAKNKKKKK
jgi:hypothetical protein